MRGALPFFERHVPVIADARDRLLAEDGVLIPRRDHVWAAIVDAPDLYADHVAPWRDRTHGLYFQPATEMLTNTWRRIRLTPDVLLSDSKCLATLDYRAHLGPRPGCRSDVVGRTTGHRTWARCVVRFGAD